MNNSNNNIKNIQPESASKAKNMDNKKVSVGGVNQMRGLFLPIKQTSGRNYNKEDKTFAVVVDNDNCNIKSTRYLTQEHKNIIDAISAYCYQDADGNVYRKIGPDGTLKIAFVPAVILKKLGKGAHNHAWLKDKILDMIDAKLDVTIYGKDKHVVNNAKIYAGVVSEYKYVEGADKKSGGFGKGRPHVIVFSSAWVAWMRSEIQINLHPDTIQKVIDTHNPLLQAIVRFIYTQTAGKEYHIKRDNLLTKIGAIRPDMAKRTVRAVNKEFADICTQLEEFGIRIKDNTIYYTRDENIVYLEHPKKLT